MSNARTAQELADELERKIGEYEVTCCIRENTANSAKERS